MKNYLAFTSLLAVTLLLLICTEKSGTVLAINQAQPAATLKNLPNLEQEVIAFLKRLDEANSKQDVGFYEQVLVPEYLFTMNGRTWTKAQVIEAKAMKRNDISDLKTAYTDMRIKAYGNVVVVTGQETTSFKDKEGKTNSVSSRSLQVLTKKNGQWRLLAASASIIEPNTMSK